MKNGSTGHGLTGMEIAVIGMAGRFPGAKNLEAFWRNVRDGIESVSVLSEPELLAAGVDPELLRDPRYVRARAVLEDIDLFDAALFGFTPREAELLDPQQRLFLESAWEALEQAGHSSEFYQGAIGVYGGASLSGYLFRLMPERHLLQSASDMAAVLAADKDFLATRVSYKLNLEGPSLTVQTACSTSLVAVHLACQGLLSGECDMALAGGVSISVPQTVGYLYQEGGIASPDGHCRAFDAKARGTVGGEWRGSRRAEASPRCAGGRRPHRGADQRLCGEQRRGEESRLHRAPHRRASQGDHGRAGRGRRRPPVHRVCRGPWHGHADG